MPTAAELDALIEEELTVGASGDEEQPSGFVVGAEEPLVHGGPDARTGVTARVRRDGAQHEVALAALTFAPVSAVEVAVAAYRRWQGR